MEDVIKIPSRVIPWKQIIVNGSCLTAGALGISVGTTVAVKDGVINQERAIANDFRARNKELRDEAKDNENLLNIYRVKSEDEERRDTVRLIGLCTQADLRGRQWEYKDPKTGEIFKYNCKTSQ